MTHYDPNDPNRIPPTQPVYTETVETVVVRESNLGWWIAGILAAAVVIAVFFILSSNRGEGDMDAQARLAEAQAEAALAQADADRALIQGQMAGAQQSVDIARSDAARAQAEAVRAANDARAAEARAATPVIIETSPPVATVDAPTVTSTSPQP